MSTPSKYTFADEEAASGKLSRKARENPFMLIGLAGLVGALGIMGYRYKSRGSMSTSVFLMQTRVVAQGTVVSCLTVGLAYQMFNKWVLHNGEDEE